MKAFCFSFLVFMFLGFGLFEVYGQPRSGKGQGTDMPFKYTLRSTGDVIGSADFNKGNGDVSVNRFLLGFASVGAVGEGVLDVGGAFEVFDFNTSRDFASKLGVVNGKNAFDSLWSYGVGLAYSLPVDDSDWLVSGRVGVSSNMEKSADFSDSLAFSGYFAVTKVFSANLQLGVALLARSRIEDSWRFLPVPFVYYRFAEQWVLGMVDRGVALSYELDQKRKNAIMLEGLFRTRRFRLADTNKVIPEGVLDYQRTFVLLSYRHFTQSGLRIKVSGGAVWQKIEIDDSTGRRLMSTSGDPAPCAFIDARYQF